MNNYNGYQIVNETLKYLKEKKMNQYNLAVERLKILKNQDLFRGFPGLNDLASIHTIKHKKE